MAENTANMIIPNEKPVNAEKLSEDEFNKELEKGYADMVAGRTKTARQVFSDIRKTMTCKR